MYCVYTHIVYTHRYLQYHSNNVNFIQVFAIKIGHFLHHSQAYMLFYFLLSP